MIHMKWKDGIFIAIFAFVAGFVVGWHPTFGSVRNFIIGGMSFGLVVEVVGVLRELFKERRDRRVKEREKLDEYIHEHNKKLMDTYIKPLRERKVFGITPENLGIQAAPKLLL